VWGRQRFAYLGRFLKDSYVNVLMFFVLHTKPSYLLYLVIDLFYLHTNTNDTNDQTSVFLFSCINSLLAFKEREEECLLQKRSKMLIVFCNLYLSYIMNMLSVRNIYTLQMLNDELVTETHEPELGTASNGLLKVHRERTPSTRAQGRPIDSASTSNAFGFARSAWFFWPHYYSLFWHQ